MSTSFDDFLRDLEAEAEASGPAAVAELETLRVRFSVARQLLTRRLQRRLTQTELSEISGVHQTEISRIERGQANPTVATLGALTTALGLEIRLVRDRRATREHR